MINAVSVNPRGRRRAHRTGLARPSHSPDNIFIHFPDHDTLLLIGNAGWVPIYNASLEDVPGYIAAPDTVTERAAAPVIGKYTGVLAADRGFTRTTAFALVQSLRPDLGLGVSGPVHP
jgi:hypothetical protein